MSTWPEIHLSDAYWFQEGPGVRNWQFTDHGIKLLNVGNILKNGSLDLSKTERHLAKDEVESRYSHFLADEGDLVIASSGITNDTDGLLRTRGAFVERQHLPLCLNTSTIRFKSKKGISDLTFLKHWLGSSEFRVQITREVTGIAQKNFGPSHLKLLTITLPPLAEQKRIAAILDKADAIRRKLQQSLRLSDDFLRSVFLDMFGDPVANPKGFPTSPLGNLGTVITGNTPSRKDPENYGDEMEWIKSDNINTPSHYLTTSQERLSKIGLKKARTAPRNSILVTCIAGSPDCIGNAAVADRTVSFNQQINAVVPTTEVDWRFLYTQILVAKGAIQAASTKSMKGMVSKSAFSAVEFLHPPLRLQVEFGKIFSTIEASRNRTTTVATDSNNLFSSLQQRAFRGEL